MRNKCHFFNPCSDLKAADARTRLPTHIQTGLCDKEVVNKLDTARMEYHGFRSHLGCDSFSLQVILVYMAATQL